MSLLEIMVRGGWLMIPIGLSSIAVIALGVERWFTLRRELKGLARFVGEWSAAPHSIDLSRFRSACRFGPRTARELAPIIDETLTNPGGISQQIEDAARRELLRLEFGLGTVATLAAVTPLIGFLGTVTGMIRAFMQIQNLGGNVNANVLAGGIWEALVTTAGGLVVGIAALVIHNYLTSLVRQAARLLEEMGVLCIRLLSGGAP